ncbi:DUF418 domain-containing protein [Allosphingosinicella sp.]|jgi:uncharacterized protein|uniref:DUF418 domain-containing protein n=1 Tax=Allosphingosinicella sp. TaxID=2823234 RepID=UPI002F2264CB
MASIAAESGPIIETPEPQAATAAPASDRHQSLDFVRGVALFGILLMNIVGMGLGPAYDNPTVAGGAEGVNLWTWFVINVGFEGTQRALFSILFGAGIILFTSRLEAAERPDCADLYFRRNLWLILFGLVNAWVLLWVGDILYYYGVTALFLYVFRKLSGRVLLGLGIGALALGAAWSAFDSQRLLQAHSEYEAASAIPAAARTPEQRETITGWTKREEGMRVAPEAFEQMRAADTASYWSAMWSRGPVIAHFQSWNLYRGFFDIFGMMLIGMGLFRLGVLTLRIRGRIYLAMMLGGYAIGLPIGLWEANWIMSNGFSPIAYQQASITYDASRLAMTIGHLGALMLFVRSGALAWLRSALAAVGRMAFTNYVAHSVVALVLFVLMGRFGAYERHQLYFIVLAIWAAQLTISPIWLRHYRFGPLEWLWRYLTYLKRPPFRRRATQETALPAAQRGV